MAGAYSTTGPPRTDPCRTLPRSPIPGHHLSIRPLLFMCVLLPLALACEPADDIDPGSEPPHEPALAPAPAGIRAASERFVAAWNGDDPAAVAAFYTEDGTATAYGSTVEGRARIEESWLPNVPIISDLRLTEESVRRVGDDWRSEGRFALTAAPPDGEPTEQTGTYGITWTRDADGEWRVRSSDVEPPALSPGARPAP